MQLPATFAALRHRDYRLWFWGQLVSLFGAWMQMTAQGYLVFELTRSPAYLGYVSFASGLPSSLLLLYGGVAADRMARRTLLLLTQTSLMACSLVLAAVTFLNMVQPWHIIAFAFCMGIANAFDAPARQAFVMDMVKREDLTNAIALNSMLFNAAVMLGPAVAGVVYVLTGPAWCFAVNGLSYTAVIAALLNISAGRRPSSGRSASAMGSLLEGLRYVAAQNVIRSLIVLVAVVCLFGFSFATLMPAWAVQVLGGDAATNGLLQSSRGCGALLSALLIASLGRRPGKGRLLTAGTFLYPLLLLAFAFVRQVPLSLALMVGVGMALLLVLNLANVLLQTLVEDRLRGRIMSIFSLTHFGLMPLGGLVAGVAAQQIGAPATVIASSLIALAYAGFVAIFLPRVRRIA